MLRIVGVRSLLLVMAMLTMGYACVGQVVVTVGFAPPVLPVYVQPPCPDADYIWTPGYWAWDGDDYYWVPGTWVLAPQPGFFWTPPYWGWGGGGYRFFPGYWGPQVGFYGGIVYGFGYFGVGYQGGRWENGHFFYNRAVNNVNVTIVHNVYNTKIVNSNIRTTRVSFNGGSGGVNARPTAQEEAYGRERHVEATAAQNQHIEAARSNQQLRATYNHGKPPVAATAKPGEFSGGHVVAARSGANYNPPPKNGTPAAGRPPVHPNELPAIEHHAAPNTGDAKLDQKYQQQQTKLYQQQNKERQQLQQKQEQEHQKAASQHYNQQQQQQMEQRHQQQTQQMVQHHQEQTQQMQQRQAPAQHGGGEHH
jgi:WXXGXW repeat (2 copies)